MQWKSYRTFREFEQQEIYRMDPLYHEIDDIVDKLFLDGLDAKFAAWDEPASPEDWTSLPDDG